MKKTIKFTNRTVTTSQLLANAGTARQRRFGFQLPPAIGRRLADTADADQEHELMLGFQVEDEKVVRCLACVNLPGSEAPICGVLDVDPELYETLPVESETTVTAIPIPLLAGRPVSRPDPNYN